MTSISSGTHAATCPDIAIALPRFEARPDAIRPLRNLYGKWRRWQTERALLSLPGDILKDIGYPLSSDM